MNRCMILDGCHGQYDWVVLLILGVFAVMVLLEILSYKTGESNGK